MKISRLLVCLLLLLTSIKASYGVTEVSYRTTLCVIYGPGGSASYGTQCTVPDPLGHCIRQRPCQLMPE